MNKIRMNAKKLLIDPAVLFLLLGFAGLILFYLWPFLISLWYAFLDKPVNGVFVGLKNYIDLFHNKPYLLGLKNTLVFHWHQCSFGNDPILACGDADPSGKKAQRDVCSHFSNSLGNSFRLNGILLEGTVS